MKTYTTDEIYAIIDKEIKRQMELKNAYIQKNGFTHKDTLDRFGQYVSALSSLYGKF